jgi:hypothetical protein
VLSYLKSSVDQGYALAHQVAKKETGNKVKITWLGNTGACGRKGEVWVKA